METSPNLFIDTVFWCKSIDYYYFLLFFKFWGEGGGRKSNNFDVENLSLIARMTSDW